MIVIDSVSTDGTLALARSFDNLVCKIISEPDAGIADAWNKGVAISRGKWITFLNAGDLFHPRHIERFKQAHDDDELNFYYCDVVKFNSNRELTNKIYGRAPSLFIMRLGGMGFAHPGSFVNRNMFNIIGNFDKNFKIAIDTDFLIRCFLHGCKFKKFSSLAYMAEGGVSDTYFSRAMKEYYESLCKNNLIARWKVSFYSSLMPVLRFFLRFFRNQLFRYLRFLKHLLIASANFFGNLLLISLLRKIYFRSVGFALSKNSSLGLGLKFYRFGNVILGKNSVINRDCLLDNRGIILIGENVSISRGVHIYTGGHDPDSPFFEMTISPVKIGDNAVIFADCLIMPGVTIGSGAVIFPGSVVTKNVPEQTIVAGNPARIIRKRLARPVYQLNYNCPMAM